MNFAEYISKYLIEQPEGTSDIHQNGGASDVPYLAEFELLGEFPELVQDTDYPSIVPSTCLEYRNRAWIGPKGTETGLHQDMMPNFLGQVFGRKKIQLLPPKELPREYVNLGMVDMFKPDYEQFPHFPNIEDIYEVILEPGDIIYIPRCWWHQVVALEASISIGCFMCLPQHAPYAYGWHPSD
jgi:hypothetical protein